MFFPVVSPARISLSFALSANLLLVLAFMAIIWAYGTAHAQGAAHDTARFFSVAGDTVRALLPDEHSPQPALANTTLINMGAVPLHLVEHGDIALPYGGTVAAALGADSLTLSAHWAPGRGSRSLCQTLLQSAHLFGPDTAVSGSCAGPNGPEVVVQRAL